MNRRRSELLAAAIRVRRPAGSGVEAIVRAHVRRVLVRSDRAGAARRFTRRAVIGRRQRVARKHRPTFKGETTTPSIDRDP